jgi:hypothetical protein
MTLAVKTTPHLKIDDFSGREGTEWLVDATPRPLSIRLDRIIPGLTQLTDARFPFTLVFSTPWEAMLHDASYLMKPADGGPAVQVDLIQSHALPGPRRFYHAVFN